MSSASAKWQLAFSEKRVSSPGLCIYFSQYLKQPLKFFEAANCIEKLFWKLLMEAIEASNQVDPFFSTDQYSVKSYFVVEVLSDEAMTIIEQCLFWEHKQMSQINSTCCEDVTLASEDLVLNMLLVMSIWLTGPFLFIRRGSLTTLAANLEKWQQFPQQVL